MVILNDPFFCGQETQKMKRRDRSTIHIVRCVDAGVFGHFAFGEANKGIPSEMTTVRCFCKCIDSLSWEANLYVVSKQSLYRNLEGFFL